MYNVVIIWFPKIRMISGRLKQQCERAFTVESVKSS